jgi:hypothetical protein
MLEIMEILSVATQKGINIYAVKGNWQLDGTLQSKVVAMAFAIAAEIERDSYQPTHERSPRSPQTRWKNFGAATRYRQK